PPILGYQRPQNYLQAEVVTHHYAQRRSPFRFRKPSAEAQFLLYLAHGLFRFLTPAVGNQPSGALRDKTAHVENRKPNHRADPEAEPPAEIHRKNPGVEN